MNYAKKLSLALDYRNKNIDSLLLGESVTKQVMIAAHLARALRITPATFTQVVNSSISESSLAWEMRKQILMTEAGDTRTSAATPRAKAGGLPSGLERTSEGPKHAKTDFKPSVANPESHKDRLARLNKEREEIIRAHHATNRAEMKSEVDREDQAFDTNGKTMANVKHYADILTKALQTTPEAERGKKTQAVVQRLIDAANKMLYDPKKHGEKKQWGLAAKYRPMAREDVNFIGDPDLEQIVLEGVVLNEFRGLVNRFRNMVGLGNRRPEPEEEDGEDEGGDEAEEIEERGNTPEEIAVNGIIDTLSAADIGRHGQTTMLQNVIKYVTKAVGTKLQDPAGRNREKIIGDYVDQMLIKQKGKPQMSMAINIGKMVKTMPDGSKDNTVATEVIRTYQRIIAAKGLKATGTYNKTTGVFDIIVTPKSPKAKTLGDAAAMAKAETTDYKNPADGTMDDHGNTAESPADKTSINDPWKNPPKGMKIVGVATQGGKVNPRQTIATDGKIAYVWSLNNKEWKQFDYSTFDELWNGKVIKGVGLKKMPKALDRTEEEPSDRNAPTMSGTSDGRRR